MMQDKRGIHGNISFNLQDIKADINFFRETPAGIITNDCRKCTVSTPLFAGMSCCVISTVCASCIHPCVDSFIVYGISSIARKCTARNDESTNNTDSPIITQPNNQTPETNTENNNTAPVVIQPNNNPDDHHSHIE